MSVAVAGADARFSLRDYLVSLGIAIGSFIVLFVNYWFPGEQIFDEIYFARAAQEYLTRQYIYENTHPPITKLLITLSTMVLGNDSTGWRFLDVVSGAVAVWLLYALVKRMSGSTLCASYAAILFAADGMHFVQSRIATPESFVVTFVLALLYMLYRFVLSAREEPETQPVLAVWKQALGTALCVVAGVLFGWLRFSDDSFTAKVLAGIWFAAGAYTVWRFRFTGIAQRWLVAAAVCLALCVASKWYTVMIAIVAIGVICYIRPTRIDRNIAMLIFVVGAIYTLSYLPQYFGLADLPTSAPRPYSWTDVVNMQISAYQYHANLTATHPYSSVWWQWPLDLRPIFYYVHGGPQPGTTEDIYSLPNPIILWAGIPAVLYVAWIAWQERRQAYMLLIVAYLAQWVPWAKTPRIAFAYHFYVDIPIICACLAISLYRIRWRWVGWTYVAIAVAAFIYFYPILAAVPIPDTQIEARHWLKSWV